VGTVIIHQDFSENFAVFVQDAVQGMHWNNKQITVHPSIAYYKQDAEVKTSSFVFVRDDTQHDNEMIYTFNKTVLKNLKEMLSFHHVIYVSDGAVSQYKNYKQFVNISMHSTDYGVSAEHHYFTTAHGKGPCDGIGAIVKRASKKASIQGKIISNAHEFSNFCNSHFNGIKCITVKEEEIKSSRELLSSRFRYTKTLKNTRTIHAVREVTTTNDEQPCVETKTLSVQDCWEKRKLTSMPKFKLSLSS
jgi:hypothetical protein